VSCSITKQRVHVLRHTAGILDIMFVKEMVSCPKNAVYDMWCSNWEVSEHLGTTCLLKKISVLRHSCLINCGIQAQTRLLDLGLTGLSRYANYPRRTPAEKPNTQVINGLQNWNKGWCVNKGLTGKTVRNVPCPVQSPPSYIYLKNSRNATFNSMETRNGRVHRMVTRDTLCRPNPKCITKAYFFYGEGRD
jgi:hypothetical protein